MSTILEHLIPLQKETLSLLGLTSQPHPPTPALGKYKSISCFCGFAYSGYLIQMKAHYM